jgi:DNA repair protein RecN (Recombination protein N)
LIDHLEIEFQHGFNLITGETGSGKSILVDAVGLLVGGRAQQEMIRQGCSQARVEGSFLLSPHNPVHQLLEQAGISLEDSALLVRREITRSGSNRIFIGGQLSTLQFLEALGKFLVDIHGQHTQQTLLHPQSHLGFLDLYGNNRELLDKFQSEYRKLKELQNLLISMKWDEKERMRQIDLLEFQISEISALNLTPGLDSELEIERALHSTAERRSQLSGQAHQLLYEDENSVISSLNQVEKLLEKLSELDPSFEPVLLKIREAQYGIEDIAYQVRDYSDSVDFDPLMLERLEERLAEIDKLKRKYGSTVDEILEYLANIKSELDELDKSEQRLETLKQDLEKQSQTCEKLADQLSEKRRSDCQNLSAAVERELADLSMSNTRLRVRLEVTSELTEKGRETAEFLFSANPGEDPRPLARIVSGGELSRIMLALKSTLKSENYPSALIFDEVDSGIGGITASVLGNKLSKLARTHQVFCVTHLPQIAGFGNQHFHVDKVQSSGRTIITIEALNQEDRVEEISRMLAGDAVTKTTRDQARQLLSPRNIPGRS